MPNHKKNESTQKQTDYARLRFSRPKMPKGKVAKIIGYSPNVIDHPSEKIERLPGYQNAVAKIAKESNSLALDIMEEFKRRGVTDFSNKDLIGALNAIGQAWSRFNADHTKQLNRTADFDNGKNRLRTIVLQSVSNQTINTQPKVEEPEPQPIEVLAGDEDLGF